eukprot:1284063-Amphidinium_carterae.1
MIPTPLHLVLSRREALLSAVVKMDNVRQDHIKNSLALRQPTASASCKKGPRNVGSAILEQQLGVGLHYAVFESYRKTQLVAFRM